jgi:hypothetical protein
MKGPILVNNKFYCTQCIWKYKYSTVYGCVSSDVIEYRKKAKQHGVGSHISNQIPRHLETPVWCEYLKKSSRKEKLIRLKTNEG